MKQRYLILLFLFALVIFGASAVPQREPGYMDSEYYYAGALRLAKGAGAQEPYLWNYLNAPESLPHPAFGYWMPLVSLLAACGLWLAPQLGFWAARLPFLLLAAAVPPLAAWMAFRLCSRPAMARLAGVLALFPGFYLAYLTTTDAFALYMVLGTAFLLLADSILRASTAVMQWRKLLALGIAAGLMHLARADGVMWLAAALAIGCGLAWRSAMTGKDRVAVLLKTTALLLIGYGMVMGAWYGRNLVVWGSLMPPGGGRTLWLTEYGQTMIYPASLLTFDRWLAAGWHTHLLARWDALLNNLQTTVAVQGGIVLFPFILVGWWQVRKLPLVRLAAVLWLVTFAVMTLVFPYAGVYGGFFHSGAAFQPLLWALAPLGVEGAVRWVARLRNWQKGDQVILFLSVLLLVTSVLLSLGLYYQRVIGSQPGEAAWNRSLGTYREVEQKLVALGAQPGDGVMVNDPPGFYLASGGRGAVVIPFGDETMLLAAASKYNVDYLILDVNDSYLLEDLFASKVQPAELELLDSLDSTQIYRIHLSEGMQ